MPELCCSCWGIDERGRFEEEDTDSLLRDWLWEEGLSRCFAASETERSSLLFDSAIIHAVALDGVPEE